VPAFKSLPISLPDPWLIARSLFTRRYLCFNEIAGVYRSMRFLAASLACLCLAVILHAQKEKREPLTEAQVDQIRDAGVAPDERIKLYAKFLGEHAEVIKGLTNRAKSAARADRLNGELEDFTALMDELGANLDEYSERHADIRKSLKSLSEVTPHWLNVLRALPGEPGFDLSRKEAIESEEELADQANRLLTEQTDYFKLHKDEEGQERAEPK
jgi:hypothetical protein